MSNLSLFMKKNKKVRENAFYAATKSLCDADGKPLEWEIKPLTTKESDKIRESCTTEVPVKGKPGMVRPKIDSNTYSAKMITASVVFPDLEDKDLQDSYGVMTPEDLLKEMLDNPVEYNSLAEFVMNFNGLDESLEEKVEEAKN